MSFGMIRLSILGGMLVLMAGCGGSGGSTGGNGSGGGTGGDGTGGGGTPTTVTYTFTGGTPTAVATQIGTGAYTQASLQSGVLTLSIPSGTTNYSVAYTCPLGITDSANFYGEYVIDASIEDGTSIRTGGCAGSGSGAGTTMGMATLQVNAAAIPGTAYVSVGQSGQSWSGNTLSISSEMVVGISDVIVCALDSNWKILAVRILRSQTIPGALNGGNPVVLGASDETVPQTVTYKNLPAGFSAPVTSVEYLTAGGAGLNLDPDETTQYSDVPSGAVQRGDSYVFSAEAESATTSGEVVSITQPSSNGGPQIFNLPSPWSYAGPTAATLPTFNFDYSGFSGMPSVRESASIAWTQEMWTLYSIHISATSKFQNGATTLAVPDLSGLTGFIAPAPSGTSIFWIAAINQGVSLTGSQSSTTQSSVQNSGTYSEP
jgi:hypothetical protein